MRNPIRKAYVDLADGQLHVHEVAGDDAAGTQPAIVFLHQTACSAQSYDPLLAELRVPNRLVAIDTPGFGGSFDPPGWPSLDDYAAWILAGIDALGIGRFHVFGHHTGSSLAVMLAARHPERVASVMLAGPVLMTPEERRHFERSHGAPIAPQRDGSHLVTNWNYAAGFNQGVDVEIIHGEVVTMLRAWKARPQAYMAVAKSDATGLAARVAAPVLLLTSPDDYFHAELDRARAAFPEAGVAVTAGANFQPTADPQGVARAIETFLAT